MELVIFMRMNNYINLFKAFDRIHVLRDFSLQLAFHVMFWQMQYATMYKEWGL